MKVLDQRILDRLNVWHCKANELSAINKIIAAAVSVGEQYDTQAVTTTQFLKSANIIAYDSQ